jgi:succinate dehydrogenase/fumarate reductase cytochrome b subunit
MAIIGVKVLLGILFLAFSCLAFLSMLHLLGAPHTSYAKILRIVHRASGGVAVGLFIVTSVMCLAGQAATSVDLSPRQAIHLTFGAIFIPLILLKILIVEKYPELRNRLFAVGTVLFTVVFVIFFTSCLTYMAKAQPAGTEGRGLTGEEISVGRDLFVVKCAKCHRLERPLSARKTPEEWAETVEAMRQKDLTWISESEAEKIVGFLTSIGSLNGN